MVRTLSLREIESYRGQGSGLQSGKYRRYFCPLHGGDHQRSFKLEPETGHFKCYSCQAWGYLTEKHEERKRAWIDQQRQAGGAQGGQGMRPPKPIGIRANQEEPPPNEGYERLQVQLEAGFLGSPAARYLAHRGIDPEMALRRFGVGYAAHGRWPHLKDGRPARQWKYGRVTFPHSNPGGDIVNFYGRAVGRDDVVPKALRHDHLPGAKGIFNAAALVGDANDTVFVCEGVFDALSLVMAGYEAACAIFGTDGIRWNWVKARRVVLCLDPDVASDNWKALAYEGTVRGHEVYWIDAATYQGHKDLSELWRATGTIGLDGFQPTTAPLPRPPLPASSTKLQPGFPDLLATLEARGVNVDGRVHRYTIDVVAVTGRVSYQRLGDGPLVQQLSAAERRRQIRPITPGARFVVADYGQIEPRIAHAVLRGRGALSWDAGEDLYRTLLGDLDGERRDEAKVAINRFLNGGAAPTVSGPGRLAEFVAGIQAYRAEVAGKALETGYVETLFGRPIPLDDHERNHGGKAVNRVVQGTAADIFNQAALAIHGQISAAELAAAVAFLLHDEVWIESMPGELDRVRALVVATMQEAARRVGVDLPVTLEEIG